MTASLGLGDARGTMKQAALLVAVWMTACSGDGGSAAIDAPALPACTGALYDVCTDNTQCTSGTCRAFNNLGVSLCTQACTPGGTACPTQNGAAVQCVMNSMICRPGAANSCMR
jgi:hypothetical protein